MPQNVFKAKDMDNLRAYFKLRSFRGRQGYLYRITDKHKLFVVVHNQSRNAFIADAVLMDTATSSTIKKFFISSASSTADALLKTAKMACEHLHETAVASSYAATTMRADLGISGVPDNGPDNM